MRKLLGAAIAGSILVVVLAQASCGGGSTVNCDAYCACSPITKGVCDAAKQAGKQLTEDQCKQALADLKSQNLCGSADASTGG